MRASSRTALLGAILCLTSLVAGVSRAQAPAAAAAAPAAAAVAWHLDYALYGHGFHVLDVAAVVHLTPDGYAISLHDHTTGFIGLLTHTDITSTASGRFDGDQVRPAEFASSGTSRGADRAVRIAYPGGEPQVQLLRPIDHDRDPVASADTLHGVDALGALAGLVRTISRTGRCDARARIFDGLRLSTITVTSGADETVPASGRSTFAGAALRCDFTSLQIGGFLHDSEEARVRRPQHGTAWMAAPAPGAPKLPVRIVFENPRFGTATLFLTRAAAGS